MGFKETVEKQVEMLAEVHRNSKSFRILANFNAVILGVLLFYCLMVGVGGAIAGVIFCLFIINGVFYFSNNYLLQGGKKS